MANSEWKVEEVLLPKRWVDVLLPVRVAAVEGPVVSGTEMAVAVPLAKAEPAAVTDAAPDVRAVAPDVRAAVEVEPLLVAAAAAVATAVLPVCVESDESAVVPAALRSASACVAEGVYAVERVTMEPWASMTCTTDTVWTTWVTTVAEESSLRRSSSMLSWVSSWV